MFYFFKGSSAVFTPFAGGGAPSTGFNATASGIRESVVKQTKPGADRLSAMKQAFSVQICFLLILSVFYFVAIIIKANYKGTFQAASAETSWNAHQFEFSDPTPEWKKKLEETKQSFQSEFKVPDSIKNDQGGDGGKQNKRDSSKESDRRKRSRWGD